MFPCLRARLFSAAATLLFLLRDLSTWSNSLMVAGGTSISAGVYWIYPPAGLIVAGLLAIVAAMLIDAADDEPRYD